MKNASPLPWRIDVIQFFDEITHTRIIDLNNQVVCEDECLDLCDADFIAKACNEYKRLIEENKGQLLRVSIAEDHLNKCIIFIKGLYEECEKISGGYSSWQDLKADINRLLEDMPETNV